MLEKEFKYYIDNQSELLKKYNGRFIAIVGNEVVGNYDSFEDAVEKTSQKYTIGTFLIQECSEGDSAYTQTYHSRAIFV